MTTATATSPVRKRRQRAGGGEGLTLLETVVAIVVGLVVLGGVGTLVYSATSTNKVTKAYQQVLTIGNNIQSFYKGTHPAYGAVPIADLIEAGIIPPSMVDSSGNAYDVWGGSVNTSPTNTLGVWFGFDKVPKEDCIQLVMKIGAALPYVIYKSSNYFYPNTQTMALSVAQTLCATGTSGVLYFVVPIS